MKANEVMEALTARVIRSMENGIVEGKWTKPWVARGALMLPPVNATTKKMYQGQNFLHLMLAGEDRCYDSGEWATYKQWQSVDAQVRKGEKGVMGIKWVLKKCQHADDERCYHCGRMFPTVFTVFNACQVDGYEYESHIDRDHSNPCARIPDVDEFFSAMGAQVDEAERNMACYVPQADEIRMPMFDQFLDASFFYSTLAHEFVHWTGHESRLNRAELMHLGTEEYAREELVAELGATVLCALLNIEDQPRPDHVEYLRSWLKHLKEDRNAIAHAAAKATAAVEFLTNIRSATSSEIAASL